VLLLGLLLVMTVGCAGPAALAPTSASAASGRADMVAPGVYMVRGTGGEPGPGNLGRTGNAGFIVGSAGVLVIDTGVSFRHGEALLAEVARITPLPVRQVVVTHTRQEFLFGAAAFRARGIPVHMHRRAAQLMAARCEGCLKTLVRVLGEDEMRGTSMFTPDAVFDDTWTSTLIGRPVQVLYLGHSSGPGDVAVFDPQSGVLFGGGLLDEGYIPDVQDSRLATWAEALSALQALPLRRIVPGHGAASGPALAGQVARYLAQLQQRTAELLAQGTALSEVADRADLAEFKAWDQYDTIHRRNASVVYLRLERELMFK
jgi:glyoxylase-like metal-dependent hydrolase (beta-lactamase superfamily II)